MAAPSDVTTHPDIAGLVAGLEPAQREAVLADEPVVCVLAGAGTGKTRVLTLRVARRVLDESAHPSHVLVCTFSRKAAQELRDRLWRLGVGRDVEAGTLHRCALRLIAHHRNDRRQAPLVVAERRPLLAELLDAGGASTRSSARAHARRTGERVRRATGGRSDVARLDAEIGWAKSRLVRPADYEEAARDASRRAYMPAARVAELYARYEQAHRLRGALDLDDLLWHSGDLLEQDPAFAKAVRWWHRHLFVDEMQDLNDAQYRLLRLLAGDDPDLFVVGDPDQSVYGWNGADPELLHRVKEEFAGTRVVRLETNHRCAPAVVRVAAAALGREAAPPSVRPASPLPVVASFDNDDEEARWVARRAWIAHRPGRAWSSIAVLARTNAQLTRMARALDAEHAPWRISGADLGPASDVRNAHEEGASGGGGSIDGSTQGADEDRVVLSTFHRAKGLQWRSVFVVGLSDGLVPLAAARSRAARAEERRLLYVALTRAEEELTCTWALRPDASGPADDVAARHPSPWLTPMELVLGELREGAAEAGPTRAAEHLSKMRDLLASPLPVAEPTP